MYGTIEEKQNEVTTMYKIKVWFNGEQAQYDETNDKEVLLDFIDCLASDESFLKCEIMYPDGMVETLVNTLANS